MIAPRTLTISCLLAGLAVNSPAPAEQSADEWEAGVAKALEDWAEEKLSATNLATSLADWALGAGTGWAISSIGTLLFGGATQPVTISEASIQAIADRVKEDLDEQRLSIALGRLEALQLNWQEYNNAADTSANSRLEDLVSDTSFLLFELKQIGKPGVPSYMLVTSLRIQALRERMRRFNELGEGDNIYSLISAHALPHLISMRAAFKNGFDSRFSGVYSLGIAEEEVKFFMDRDGDMLQLHSYMKTPGTFAEEQAEFESQLQAALAIRQQIIDDEFQKLRAELLDGIDDYILSLQDELVLGWQVHFEEQEGHWTLRHSGKPIGARAAISLLRADGSSRSFTTLAFTSSQAIPTLLSEYAQPVEHGDRLSATLEVGGESRTIVTPVPTAMQYHPGGFQGELSRSGFSWVLSYSVIPRGGLQIPGVTVRIDVLRADDSELTLRNNAEFSSQVQLTGWINLINDTDRIRITSVSDTYSDTYFVDVPQGMSNHPGALQAKLEEQGGQWVLNYQVHPPGGLQPGDLSLRIELVRLDSSTALLAQDASFSAQIGVSDWAHAIVGGDTIEFTITMGLHSTTFSYNVPEGVNTHE